MQSMRPSPINGTIIAQSIISNDAAYYTIIIMQSWGAS